MESLLHQIYCGDYRPSEQIRTASEGYRKTEKKHEQCYEDLARMLPADQKELLDRLLGYCSDLGAMDVETAFAMGMKDGARFMAEILNGKAGQSRCC